MKYKAGTTILEAPPLCCVLSNRFRGRRCDSCFALPSGSLSRCSACKVVYFCGRECQQRLWPLHRNECAAIKALAKQSASPQDWVPTDTVRLLFYVLEMYLDRTLLTVDKQDPGWKTSPFDLCSHVNDVRIDLARSEQFAHIMLTLKRMTDALVSSGVVNFRMPDTSLVLTLFGIVCINGITILDQEMNALGIGLYLSPSALDHSCRPNCVPVFDGTRLILRSISDIESDSEKLTINYIDLLQTREERQSQLRSQYYFTCDCPICDSDSSADSKMKVGRCTHCEGACIKLQGGSYACSECKAADFDADYATSVENALTDAQFAIEQLKSRKHDVQDKLSESSEVVLKLAKSCLDRTKDVLFDSNIYVTVLAAMAAEACITLAQWPSALKFAKQALIGYREHLPQNYPLVGLMLARIGKITLFLGNSGGEALPSLLEAYRILSTAYPPKSQIVNEVQSMIDQCEEELRCNVDDERRRAISGYE